MVESVELNLNDELIVAARVQSMEAHRSRYVRYVTSAPSTDVLIFAFKGSWEVRDWYGDDDDDDFGETYVDHLLFPSLQRIGEGRLAKVNKAFLQRFRDLLNKSRFKMEVEKAVKESKKILVTGHSSGGAIASFATLWILEEYARKRAINVPIRCVTFGSPLIGDRTLSHAVQRQNWATRFTHFVMEHDVVPRLMLAPKISVREHLPDILRYYQRRILDLEPEIAIHPDQAVEFLENLMVKASVVVRYTAFGLMEHPDNLLMENLSRDYVKISPYTPFGTYAFCIRDRMQLFVKSPETILQLLFNFLQLTDERQDLPEFAVNCIAKSLSYEEGPNNGLQRVDLREFNGGDAPGPLFELGERAIWCLTAAEEADKRKTENENMIDLLRLNQSINDIRDYKVRHSGGGQTDYYDAFKLQIEDRDFLANVNRLKLAKIWDEVVEMLRRNDLPDEFEGCEEWVRLGTEFRRLVEPLDIANYYRHSKGSGYMGVRPKRYKFTQRWYEHANVTGFEEVSESNFMGVVEELRRDVEEQRNRTPEEVKEGFDSIQEQVIKWFSDEKIRNEDVYWGEPTLSMLREILSPGQ